MGNQSNAIASLTKKNKKNKKKSSVRFSDATVPSGAPA